MQEWNCFFFHPTQFFSGICRFSFSTRSAFLFFHSAQLLMRLEWSWPGTGLGSIQIIPTATPLPPPAPHYHHPPVPSTAFLDLSHWRLPHFLFYLFLQHQDEDSATQPDWNVNRQGMLMMPFAFCPHCCGRPSPTRSVWDRRRWIRTMWSQTCRLFTMKLNWEQKCIALSANVLFNSSDGSRSALTSHSNWSAEIKRSKCCISFDGNARCQSVHVSVWKREGGRGWGGGERERERWMASTLMLLQSGCNDQIYF